LRTDAYEEKGNAQCSMGFIETIYEAFMKVGSFYPSKGIIQSKFIATSTNYHSKGDTAGH
jgi:hypothetical protein